MRWCPKVAALYTIRTVDELVVLLCLRARCEVLSVFCSLLGLLFFSEFLFSVRRFLGLYYRYGTSISESIYVINWVKLDYLVYGMDFGLHQGRRTSGPVGSLRYHYVVHPGVSLLFSSGVSSPCHIFGRRLKPCCFCLFP